MPRPLRFGGRGGAARQRDHSRSAVLLPVAEDAGESLRARLGRTALQHSHAALDAYRREEYETFYVEAGIALELAMKAKLAGVSPYLLAADGYGWFMHGHRMARGDTILPGPKSVSAKDAMERLRAIDADLVTGIAAQITETIDRRDQSVHMGAYSRPTDDELLTHAAVFVEAVNGLTLQAPSDFWEDLTELATELVAKERDVVRLRVLKSIADARTRLATLSQEERDMFEETELTYFQDHQEEQSQLVVISCPVCGRAALVNGELTDDGEPIWERGERDPIGWAYDINTILTGFDCKVCRLVLDGADEIAAAGLPAKVSNDHADPHRLYEPDPDPW